jgi:hypothetical protein
LATDCDQDVIEPLVPFVPFVPLSGAMTLSGESTTGTTSPISECGRTRPPGVGVAAALAVAQADATAG